ncbi:hypothetical protein F2Q69_00047220 [Brassica cretica]|uniref:Uncharacterized protein n=1 Tax=Brassica cretica TaxID=69181 RepID=A0A8S9PXP2_BRACR|nr:hypothetical protein F2Q69_00047220 [Brassica cretica]
MGATLPERRHELAVPYLSERPYQSDNMRSLAIFASERPPRATGRSRSSSRATSPLGLGILPKPKNSNRNRPEKPGWVGYGSRPITLLGLDSKDPRMVSSCDDDPEGDEVQTPNSRNKGKPAFYDPDSESSSIEIQPLDSDPNDNPSVLKVPICLKVRN